MEKNKLTLLTVILNGISIALTIVSTFFFIVAMFYIFVGEYEYIEASKFMVVYKNFPGFVFLDFISIASFAISLPITIKTRLDFKTDAFLFVNILSLVTSILLILFILLMI